MKQLICTFHSGAYSVGDSIKVPDAEAEVLLNKFDGYYKVWALVRDLGPDQVVETAATVLVAEVETPEKAEEPKAEEAEAPVPEEVEAPAETPAEAPAEVKVEEKATEATPAPAPKTRRNSK